MISEGMTAPDFVLDTDEGISVSLSSYSGKTIVLYFYPKDDTPGCTKEACGFRDVFDAILKKGAVVIGVSPDTAASHAKFRKKYDLPFVLLADPEAHVLKAYGAWGEKSMYGKKYDGVLRSTFIIGPDGMVKKAFPKVTPDGHAEEILALL